MTVFYTTTLGSTTERNATHVNHLDDRWAVNDLANGHQPASTSWRRHTTGPATAGDLRP